MNLSTIGNSYSNPSQWFSLHGEINVIMVKP